jgi:phosphoglycerol transferase
MLASAHSPSMQKLKSLATRVAFHSALTIVLGVLMAWQFDLAGKNLNVPIAFGQDTMHFLAAARAMIDSSDWHETARISAPFGFPLLAFPADGVLGRIVMRIITWFASTPGMAVNLQFFLYLIVAGNLMAWCMRQLRVDREICFVSGILYGLLPFHQIACTNHLMTIPVLAPPILTWAVLFAHPDELGSHRRRRILLTLTCLGGLMSIYPAFFAGCALAIGTVTGWLASRDRRTLRWGGAAAALLAATFIAGNIPAIQYWLRDPLTLVLIDEMKSPREADIYAPLLRNLILPPPTHPFPPFAWIGHRMESAGLPLDHWEVAPYTWLGTTAGMGFVSLLVVLAGFVPKLSEGALRLVRQAGAIALGLFLLATAGGFGSVWNVMVTSQTRSYVRVVPYIAGLALPVGLLVLLGGPKSRWMRLGLAAAVALFGVWDQSATRAFPSFYPRDSGKYVMLSEFVGRLEARYPNGAMVFQLPWMPYPSTPTVHELRANEHIAPYVVSRTLRWSWPAFTARSTNWQRFVSGLDGKPLCDRLALAGFSALWIDLRGYADKAARLRGTLDPLLGPPVMNSPGGNIVVYDLSHYRDALKAQFAHRDWAMRADEALHLYYSWGTPYPLDGTPANNSFVFAVRGIGGAEGNRFSWTLGRATWLAFEVAAPAAGDVRLDLTTMPHGVIIDHFRLNVSVDECDAGAWTLRRGPELHSLTLPARCVAGKKSFIVKLNMPDAVSPRHLGQGEDSRQLGVALRSVTATPASRVGDR